MSLDRDLELANRLADAGDAITRPHVGRATPAETKADGSPLTSLDLEVERTLVDLIKRERPDDGFLGEEFGEPLSGSRRWIVDGMDGTASFTLGRGEWATLIALEVDGVVEIGIATAPALGCRWWAARGQGAWRRDASGEARLPVSPHDTGTPRMPRSTCQATGRQPSRGRPSGLATSSTWSGHGFSTWPRRRAGRSRSC